MTTTTTTTTMTRKQALECWNIVGGLGTAGKMPGWTYGLEAGTTCPLSARLIARHGTDAICHGCYAMKGHYVRTSVKRAHDRRLAAIADPRWMRAMAALLNYYVDHPPTRNGQPLDTKHFRWHDSGDLVDLQHLRKIVDVARRTPRVRHWLPTHEYQTVRLYLRSGGTFPSNLTVRVSAETWNTAAPDVEGLPTSTAGDRPRVTPESHACPSREQGNSCGECRACWDRNVLDVTYHRH